MRCPGCNALLEEGFLPIQNGLHWIRRSGALGSNMAEDIPGTHAVLRSNRMEAWRCKKCKLISFRYGQSVETSGDYQKRYAAEADAAAEE